jgi:hypothetical protein
MFSENDKGYIIEVLAKRLALEDLPRGTIANAFSGTTLAVDLTTKEGVSRIVMDAVRLCILDGWNNDPTWMQRLLDLFSLRDIDAKVDEIWERSKHKPPPAPDPYSQTVLNNVTPFVNRSLLRNHMQRLAAPVSNTQPILVVIGGDKTGKSYSTNYIDHFANHKNTVIACSAKLDQDIGLDLTAEKLAKKLVSQMGVSVDDIPGPETNMRAYAESLADWVLNNGSQLDVNCWFVLDNFKGASLHQGTSYFITALSNLITQGVYARKCRLILIGIDRSVLTVEPGKLDEEIIQYCNRQDVVVTVTEIVSRAFRALNPEKITDFLLYSLPADPSQKMTILNGRLRSLLQAINRLNLIMAPLPQPDYEGFLLNLLKDLPENENRRQELDERLDDLNESLSK